jgi:hypothetical protein
MLNNLCQGRSQPSPDHDQEEIEMHHSLGGFEQVADF